MSEDRKQGAGCFDRYSRTGGVVSAVPVQLETLCASEPAEPAEVFQGRTLRRAADEKEKSK